MSPRVLFIDQSGQLGGGELSLLDLARRRRDSSKVLLLADGPFHDCLKQESIPVEVLDAGVVVQGVRRNGDLRNMAASGPALLGLARRVAEISGSFDLIYANSQKALVVAGLASLLCRRPMIWHLRDMITSDHFGRAGRLVAVQVANRRARRVVTNSSATADAFKSAGGRTSKVRVVHNGIDAAPFEAINEQRARQRLRAELGCADHAVLIGHFSRLAEWKGQHVLLDALVQMPNVHAVLVGANLFGETRYEHRLHRIAEQPSLSGRVHFLGFRHEIPALMKGVDIIVHTSIDPEPFGRVIVEGMMARKPVIAARAGGVVELIRDHVDGLLVQPGDPIALCSAIRQLTSNPELAQRIAISGRDTSTRRFSLDACSASIDAVISEALRQSTRPSIS